MNDIHAQITPNYSEFKKLFKKSKVIPLYKDILADLETPVSTFLKLAKGSKYSFLLESVEGGERWGRYSFISWDPKYLFTFKDSKYSFSSPDEKKPLNETCDPIDTLKSIMNDFSALEIEGLPIFWGGAVGFGSYDVIRFIENLPNKPDEFYNLPDLSFMITDKMVIFDHLRHSVKILSCAGLDGENDPAKAYAAAAAKINQIENAMRKPLKALKRSLKSNQSRLVSNLSEKAFTKIVTKAKSQIYNGEIIQVVLSQRFSKETNAAAFELYRALRLINPSPYMYFLKFDDFEIIGSSPEILVRKEGNIAETRPLAGTRKRGATIEEEEALVSELLSDPKERAEHIMLVDLGRNDLGRVCQNASVKVSQLMQVEKYSHVMHIVSSVTGVLKPGTDAFDLFKACFPAGTVSGAPKIRAMEIIDELEPQARGPYAGAVGYFSFSGNMDMAITIRTIIYKDKTAYIQAGAGIVADSIPKNEYIETKNKAKALFKALETAEKGLV